MRIAFVLTTMENAMRPKVAVVIDEGGNQLEKGEYINLSQPSFQELSIIEAIDHRPHFGSNAAEFFYKLEF